MRNFVVKTETIEELMDTFVDDDFYNAFMKELMFLGDSIHEFNLEYISLPDCDDLSFKAMRIVVLASVFFRDNFDVIRDLMSKIQIVPQTEELKSLFAKEGINLDENTNLEGPIEFC